ISPLPANAPAPTPICLPFWVISSWASLISSRTSRGTSSVTSLTSSPAERWSVVDGGVPAVSFISSTLRSRVGGFYPSIISRNSASVTDEGPRAGGSAAGQTLDLGHHPGRVGQVGEQRGGTGQGHLGGGGPAAGHGRAGGATHSGRLDVPRRVGDIHRVAVDRLDLVLLGRPLPGHPDQRALRVGLRAEAT